MPSGRHFVIIAPVGSSGGHGMRIALGAFLHEGNTLTPVPTELGSFSSKYLEYGNGVVERLDGTATEVAGALSVLSRRAADVVPLIATHGGAGGRLTRDCYQHLRRALLTPLEAAASLDGVYLALHGACIAEGEDDTEGDILEAARRIVGPEVPIAVSLDIHAYVTPRMIRNADVIIGYQLYPHDDVFETGQRAAGLLVRTLKGEIRPVLGYRRAPMIMPVQRTRTRRGAGPLADAHVVARAAEAAGEVLAASYFTVQPWMDLPDLRYAAVTVTDGDADAADRVALEMAKTAWARREDYLVPLVAPAEAIARGLEVAGGPVVLSQAADNPGSGATSDSAAVLAALLAHAPEERSAVLLVDPETVAEATAAGAGATIRARIGNKANPALHGAPVAATATVERLFDGRFTYSGGVMGGVTAGMGPSAVLAIGPVRVVCITNPTYEYGDEQYRAAGIDPKHLKFIAVKNPMNYQQAFDWAPAQIMLDTPGASTQNLRIIDWQRLKRPCWPMDTDFEPNFPGP